jgi:rod shape-determining protein MreB
MTKKSEALRVGIDLGTSRSSISASNGARHVVDSYVGWPVDMVARKVVKKPIMFGREALENRPMLDLHRPLERGLIKEGSEKDEAAVRELLRHLIGMAMGGDAPPTDQPARVYAVVGVPAEALRVSKQHLRNAVRGIADALMIVSEPFAVAYGMDALLHTMIVDIGAGTTDFCVMNGRYPTDEDQRTLTHAGDWVDEQLATLVRGRQPDAQFSVHMVREWKERWSFVGEPKRRALVNVPVKGKATELDITDEMRAACESIVPPICETMMDLLARVEPEYQHKVRNNVILAGGSALIPGLSDVVDRALSELGGGRSTVVKDPIFAGSDGGLAIARDATSADWDKLSL